MRRKVLVPVAILSFLLSLSACFSLRDEPDLSGFIESRMRALGAASLSGGIRRGEELVWSSSWGMADLEAGIPESPDTVYRLASVPKLMTGIAAMTLVERGMLDLDADVSVYLPFAVLNLHKPDMSITPRMLMNHTSSVMDDWPYLDTLTG